MNLGVREDTFRVMTVSSAAKIGEIEKANMLSNQKMTETKRRRKAQKWENGQNEGISTLKTPSLY